ncbi:methyltransferase domain-containing protein [bacterium]|nr:methyltransferase domain-containing protein [bacterium]
MPDDRTDPRLTFSRSADRYLISDDHQSGSDLDVIRQMASLQSPSLTVDVATGAGHALAAAGPFSKFCVAVDLTMEMLQVTREHLSGAGLENVQFIQSAADHLPLANSTASLLLCRIAPHHFASIPGFLDEVVRVLEPEGRCVIIDSIVPEEADKDRFINEIERLRDPSHMRSHTLRQWLKLFEKTGLQTISVELFERTHLFQKWAKRTGLDEVGIRAVEERFQQASLDIQEKFKVQLDDEGKVDSYTDEKGIFLLKKMNSEA